MSQLSLLINLSIYIWTVFFLSCESAFSTLNVNKSSLFCPYKWLSAQISVSCTGSNCARVQNTSRKRICNFFHLVLILFLFFFYLFSMKVDIFKCMSFPSSKDSIADYHQPDRIRSLVNMEHLTVRVTVLFTFK